MSIIVYIVVSQTHLDALRHGSNDVLSQCQDLGIRIPCKQVEKIEKKTKDKVETQLTESKNNTRLQNAGAESVVCLWY